MRTLTAVEFLSVDGVMQGLGSPDEDRSGGFEHGGWGAPFAEAIHEAVSADGLSETTAYLLGRTTYDKMAAFWPDQPDSNPMAAHLNATPKHVASRTMTSAGWRNTTVLTGDLTEEVSRLKVCGDGTVVILGSGVLVRDLMRADLIDAFRLFVHPLVLGLGKRLFGDLDSPRELTLTGCETTSMGSIVVSYDVTKGG